MRSNYKKLGDYIELVSHLNTNLQYGEVDVRGVSNNKKIIQTRANNEGRDFNKFYVVEPKDFIYNSRTSRMGEKVGLGYNDTNNTIITSFNNTVFRVKDGALLPMYLFMWFNRPEFDRYARVHSWGSSTEIFSWEEMCNVTLPIPHIDKQQEVVREYNIIQNLITLNHQLITKLEETAQAIYKQWLVDFEFPDENGKPYKSNGGEMIWSEELEKEIPGGWNVEEFQKITDVTSGKSLKWEMGNKYPVYGAGGITGYTDEFLFDKTIIIIGRVGTHGKVFIEYNKSWPTDNTLVFIPKYLCYSYFILKELNYDELNKGGVQALLTQTDLKQIKILVPKFDLNEFENTVKPILLLKKNIDSKNQKLEELKELLLAKMTKVESEINVLN